MSLALNQIVKEQELLEQLFDDYLASQADVSYEQVGEILCKEFGEKCIALGTDELEFDEYFPGCDLISCAMASAKSAFVSTMYNRINKNKKLMRSTDKV